ncbi:hypothetical protein [Zhihengliuella halotolerans]|uniref:Uncharacterized protein n=1 Tax=Zhihengliuella halotolerans TaxID=370736 RepID=A0A4Q8AE42_9MICC|nr:hypothetical protein [Zhihengliuella halotolerans]RZU61903.1 hypothetical protein EV380_1485 [Zhihengliuella halotolerans]
MSSQTHPPTSQDATDDETPRPTHDTLKPSAAFVIWGIVLLTLSPLASLPLFSAFSSGELAYMDPDAVSFLGFTSTIGALVGLILLLVGVYRALTAVHVGAREAARASGRLTETQDNGDTVIVQR